MPIPFLDDHLLRRSRRALVDQIGRRFELQLTADQQALLAASPDSSRRGCLSKTAFILGWPILKRVLRRWLRTILFFLTVKDASVAASRFFNEALLLEIGARELSSGGLRGPDPAAALTRLRTAIDATLDEVDSQPIQRAMRPLLRSSWRLLRRTAKSWIRRDRQTASEEERGEWEAAIESDSLASELGESLAAKLAGNPGYLDHLVGRFSLHLRVDEPSQPPK